MLGRALPRDWSPQVGSPGRARLRHRSVRAGPGSPHPVGCFAALPLGTEREEMSVRGDRPRRGDPRLGRAALRGAPAVDQQLDWLTVVLIVLIQAERRDPAESLLCCCWLTDLEHERHDRLLTWLRKLGMLQAGAPHFRLTAWGRVVLAGLRCVGRLCAARRYGVGAERPPIESSGRPASADRSRRG